MLNLKDDLNSVERTSLLNESPMSLSGEEQVAISVYLCDYKKYDYIAEYFVSLFDSRERVKIYEFVACSDEDALEYLQSKIGEDMNYRLRRKIIIYHLVAETDLVKTISQI